MDEKPVCQRIWSDSDLDCDLRMYDLYIENCQEFEAQDERLTELVANADLANANDHPFSLYYDFAQRVVLHIHYPEDFSDELPER